MNGAAVVLGWLGLAALALGAVWASLAARRQGRELAVSNVLVLAAGVALLLQALALVAHGLAAQSAAGNYWSWTRAECYRLAAWLATAILVVGQRRLGWQSKRGWAAYLLVLLAVALGLAGAWLMSP